ncbi:hypothetical protein A11A3_05711 [Alcanivorax hongdengensis A-11-3]|uniref:Uncharacterized protein n=1 Tax=Alcanivorax hongdengensis A-11-3 TaxID=1177179 RepID=L0WGJ7_9GAMM|nr:cytochrome oxidase putative small subunit CydP [Alcanivorax hongdengensis]EKF74925.1 hypothetical protein A11A3_05711 [Alcanivorax hongdengensis A-11-3]
MPRLQREISLTLLFKLVALFLLWLLFFRSDLRLHPDAQTIEQSIFSSSTTSPTANQGGSTHGP